MLKALVCLLLYIISRSSAGSDFLDNGFSLSFWAPKYTTNIRQLARFNPTFSLDARAVVHSRRRTLRWTRARPKGIMLSMEDGLKDFNHHLASSSRESWMIKPNRSKNGTSLIDKKWFNRREKPRIWNEELWNKTFIYFFKANFKKNRNCWEIEASSIFSGRKQQHFRTIFARFKTN